MTLDYGSAEDILKRHFDAQFIIETDKSSKCLEEILHSSASRLCNASVGAQQASRASAVCFER